MEDMNELQMTCFEIISYVGTAKSMYINAVQKAKEGDFDAAAPLLSGRMEKDGTLTVWYDAAWQPGAEEASATYCLRVVPAAAEQAEVEVQQGDTLLLSLPFAWHRPLHF